MIAPKPPSRPDKVSLWRYFRLFRSDILSAQPNRLYRAWMAEFRTPFFRSYLCNDPELVDLVLKGRPRDFPKSDRVREGLALLLGQSVFVTNGDKWNFQRRIIDPAFERGRLHDSFQAMLAAAREAEKRLRERSGGIVEVEEETSHAAADVIFRSLFSIPITHEIAARVFAEFRSFQRAQPLLNLAAFLPLPRFVPRLHRREARASAQSIRVLIRRLTDARAEEISNGTAPDDLATKIMTKPDPVTGRCFDADEMVDQVAIFFLAGHETSASALAWSLYLLAANPEVQDRAAIEAASLSDTPTLSEITKLSYIRDVFRETLRLYPPVPMMVRETVRPEEFRGRSIGTGAQIVLSPWHLHRHERIWDRPDDFLPERWRGDTAREAARKAYLPFSAGPRVCPGAAFAMVEGPLLLATLLRTLRFDILPGATPVPVAHLTVRSQAGIRLTVRLRDVTSQPVSGLKQS